ncbi:MAG: triose-phosphate isomerase [Micrococcaceae bacterium]
MSRIPLVAGNWKMNLNHEDATNFYQKLTEEMAQAKLDAKNPEVVIFPPFTDLRSLQVISGDQEVQPQYGGQDVSAYESGAYTGEISPDFLTKLGCTYTLVGHSERRTLHGETDADALAKTKSAIKAGLTVMLCVGEPLEERKAGTQVQYTLAQVKAVVSELSADELEKFVIAYEPVWAIGTGEVATAQDAQDMAAAIREDLAKLHDANTADAMRILYGGSVKGSNAAEIIGQKDVDGALVGGASLDADDFVKIIQGASS